MPANPKYLSSPGQRVLKISAGLLGGYMLSATIHLVIALIPGIGISLLVSGTFSVFLLWVVFMILAFLARNGWLIWGIYLLLTLVFGVIAYSGGGAL
ncbi:hypothetical protein [Agriterribacter sp.]|uniref:hypothetical protein n=1 Tax=Agriterribacter sp. TaxID=2821509 RepID=UPI002CDB8526|nr:hypothetical protein [Agriterribacter sp.]HRP56667.1 hypothetical protein [Agriterribacter sp.]